jgi:LmbE family N-acetylglucosaminyl deacetylase
MTDHNKKSTPNIYLFLMVVFSFFSLSKAHAQAADRKTSSEIFQEIKKLNFLGSALFVAAHPDDENTRLISYLANDVQAEVAYLSLTRGDGGQNLIGTEIREGLGLIRTQELLQARRVDGGNQFFTTANDFGYSKIPDETFTIWDRDKVESDVVWVIRNFKPDIIINRFDHRTPGTTHGHHTSSAIISHSVFDKSGDESYYPTQLSDVDAWQPSRLFFNTTYWFYGGRAEFEKMDKSHLYQVDSGSYYPELSWSNNEIAARSRSMHKSQGFGAQLQRGEQTEYLELLKGEDQENKKDLFAGINTTWSRVEGGGHIAKIVEEIILDFDLASPESSLESLFALKSEVSKLPSGHWRNLKLIEIENILVDVSGLFIGFDTNESLASPGSKVAARLEVIARSTSLLSLDSLVVLSETSSGVTSSPLDLKSEIALVQNRGERLSFMLELEDDLIYSNSYWLNLPASQGNYSVTKQDYVGLPESESPVRLQLYLSDKYGNSLQIKRSLKHRFVDRVRGEVVDPFHIVPELSINFTSPVTIFADTKTQEIGVKVKTARDNVNGVLRLKTEKGWDIEPNNYEFNIESKGGEQEFFFKVKPPKNSQESLVYGIADFEGKQFDQSDLVIEYDHIPKQILLQPATAKLARVKVEIRGKKVGYLMGAGDEVPEAIEQMGYEVVPLEVKNLRADNLVGLDAIVMGIRAYNVFPELRLSKNILLSYVENGGNLIVQYNTNRGIDPDEIGPYTLQLSRDRVTVENAEVRFLEPAHPLLNYPNEISPADFDFWVQERGLYFANEWDDRYTAILSSNDPNEPPREGGLLVTKYGKGYFMYSGYSWFRELPAGVVGAYRIFANMLSIGN